MTSRSYIILAAMVTFLAFVQCFIGTVVWIFVLINIMSIGFVAKFVPENKGHSLESLKDRFRTDEPGHLTQAELRTHICLSALRSTVEISGEIVAVRQTLPPR